MATLHAGSFGTAVAMTRAGQFIRCNAVHISLLALVLSLLPARAAEPKLIALPPFLVEEKAQRLPWRYAEVGEWEVLSTCSERFTRVLIANHHRLHVLLGELLPPELRFRTSEKQTLLFIDSTHQPPSSQEVVAAMTLTAAERDRLEDIVEPLVDDGRLRRRPPPPRYTFVPNLRLWDRDAGSLFAVVRESEFDPNRIALTPDYIGYLVRSRVPALPPWFISGILTVSAQAKFTEDTLTLERLDWPPEIGSAALKAGPEGNRALLPLADFFAGDLSGESAQGEALALWQAQAALFVRWGVSGRGAPRREALWTFAKRAAVEPVTEKLFQECFGMDFSAAQKQLAAYLPEAMRTRLELRATQRLRPADVPLRPASHEEVARIRGDWERLEIAYVKEHFPILTHKYVEQARRTLMRAYDAGSREPRLLAVIGLCEVDAGNDAAARPFLEDAAARSRSLRPRASFELARLRFAALRDARAGAQTRLTTEQVNDVLTPLLAARGQQPPLPEIYELIADVWAASAAPPARADLAVLEEGVRLFPRRADLVYRTAELNLRHGFSDTARWLVTLGITLAPDRGTRARFEALQAQIAAPPR